MTLRPFRLGLLLFLFVTCAAVPRVAAESLQFDAPVAPFCVDGTFPVVVTTGGVPVAGTLAMAAGDKGVVTGTLAIGAEVFTLAGKQSVKKGVLAVSLKGPNAAGLKVALKGSSAGAHLAGAITGKLGGAKLAAKSTFDADLTGAPAFIVRCAFDATIDTASGTVTGAGLAHVCGTSAAVTVTGSTNYAKALASGKPATGKLKIVGSTFSWSGKGALTQSEMDGSLGFVVSWKGKGLGVAAAGKALPVAQAVDGPSPGVITLDPAFATRFNTVTLTNVPLTVSGAVPSSNALDYVLTRNGVPIAPGLTIDAQQGTIMLAALTLLDTRNDIRIIGKDAAGLTLDGTVTLWGGPHEVVIVVRDESAEPVAGASVEVRLGDDQQVMASGTTDAAGEVVFGDIPNRTLLVRATGPGGAFGTASDTGIAGVIQVVLQGFDAPSMIDNNDFATGDASGWNVAGAPTSVIPHVEDVGPLASLARAPLPPPSDFDLQLATAGEGAQTVSRTFVTKPNTVAVKLRYRFVTLEIPGGYFGTKWNDAFSVSIRSFIGGGNVFEANTMNGLGLAAFDGSGATAWREATLPLSSTGDVVQLDVSVANVADGLFDSFVIIDKVQEISIDLQVANASRLLLETNRFEITVDPPDAGSNFAIEIRRASAAAWFTLGTERVVADYKQRVAGTFKVRGRATIDGQEQTTQEKDLVVQFPTYADIVGNAAVVTMTDAAWASTKAAANATARREEGFFILLDTNVGQDKYTKSATVLGPSVGPAQTGSVNIVKPPDNPAAPTPIQSAVYTVASFHTHTPTRFRPFSRAVGPSGADQTADTADGVPGVVYDYVGVGGFAPAGHPLDSPAQRYASGPNRRATPP